MKDMFEVFHNKSVNKDIQDHDMNNNNKRNSIPLNAILLLLKVKVEKD